MYKVMVVFKIGWVKLGLSQFETLKYELNLDDVGFKMGYRKPIN